MRAIQRHRRRAHRAATSRSTDTLDVGLIEKNPRKASSLTGLPDSAAPVHARCPRCPRCSTERLPRAGARRVITPRDPVDDLGIVLRCV